MNNYLLIALAMLTTCKITYNSQTNALDSLRQYADTYYDQDGNEDYDNDAMHKHYITWKLTDSEDPTAINDIIIRDCIELFTYHELQDLYQSSTPQGKIFISNNLYPKYDEHTTNQQQATSSTNSQDIPNPPAEDEIEQILKLHQQKMCRKD